jgi:hypothetical protein
MRLRSDDLLNVVFPNGRPEHMEDYEYGCGMIASVAKGEGEVFCAGTTEWILGLMKNDYFTIKITKNVLDRYCGRKSDDQDQA